jgi:hypothetical protein
VTRKAHGVWARTCVRLLAVARAEHPNYILRTSTLYTWNLGAWLRSMGADAESNAGVGTGPTTTGAAIADI